MKYFLFDDLQAASIGSGSFAFCCCSCFFLFVFFCFVFCFFLVNPKSVLMDPRTSSLK